MCRTRDEAERMFMAVKLWLKERLDLEISPEKSKITNLRKKPSVFLGFSIKAVVKGIKRVANSRIKPKAIVKIIAKGKGLIKKIQKSPTTKNQEHKSLQFLCPWDPKLLSYSNTL